MTEIAIQFRKPPFLLFRERASTISSRTTRLNIQPNEGLALRFGAKVPGTLMNIGTVRMEFEYEDYFHKQRTTGYERLMFDCMLGDATLFQRADMVEAGWAIIEPIQEAWRQTGRQSSLVLRRIVGPGRGDGADGARQSRVERDQRDQADANGRTAERLKRRSRCSWE